MAKSPVVKSKKIQTMSFAEALTDLIAEKKITRLEWANTEEYGYLKDGYLLIHTRGEDHTWQVHLTDIIANDWVAI